ncbi:S41 family peptidase [Coprothermobacteraceae bacterium]|nr:S41 family peptidase [Coprothermobacteraceae bacterium]
MSRKFVAAIVVTLLVGLVGGYVLAFLTDGRPVVLEAGDYTLLDEVKAVLKQDYYADIPADKELLYGAAKGLTQTLNDPWTEYLTPDELATLESSLQGNYAGIGVVIEKVGDQVVIQTVFPGTPAYRKGLLKGDIIEAVDGQATSNKSLDAVSSLIRGEPGTTVRLDIVRGETKLTVEVVREEITIPSVMESKMLTPTVGYIQLIQFFDQRASNEFRQSLLSLRSQGAQALVIDLRDNPGGMLDEARKIVGFFAPGKVVVYERNKTSTTPLKAPLGTKLFDGRVVLWVDGGSASASEIVAGALRDLLGAKLLGEKTFGKGEIQTIQRLSEGALKVTVAEYLTPNQVAINRVGLEPDLAVTATDDTALLKATLKLLNNP